VKKLPATSKSLVLRTDFSDAPTWEQICAAIQQPQTEDKFQAMVECISDPAFAGLTPENLVSLSESDRSFVFLVDSETISNREHPVLAVDLFHDPGRTFRVIPSEMWGVENNLSLSNMDFFEFADAADEDGVFRGF
jgi:Domain of unknown function (DUF6924)